MGAALHEHIRTSFDETMTRFTLLPDPRFEPLRDALKERMRAASQAVDADTFDDLLDPVMRSTVFDSFARAGAQEGTVWLVDREGEHLVPAVNNGPNAADFVGNYKQPLSRGLISMVFATEQPFCENQVYAHEAQDKSLDQRLGVKTCSMMAVPLYFAHELRGVISCVQVKPASQLEDPPEFSMDSIRHVQLASVLVGRLLDHRLLSVTVGWEGE